MKEMQRRFLVKKEWATVVAPVFAQGQHHQTVSLPPPSFAPSVSSNRRRRTPPKKRTPDVFADRNKI